MSASATLCASPAVRSGSAVNDRLGLESRSRLRFAVHGPAVGVDNFLPHLDTDIRRLLAPFAVAGWPDGFAPVHGTVRAYEQAEVLRHLSPTARPVAQTVDLAEVFEEGERFWIVDERWGMTEINFLKGQWRSWVLPRPQLDPVRCAEMAVLWPLAQLLRPRGVYLLPAAAAVRDGWAFLLLCPFGVEPELTALVRSGYRLIGQRWTAVREEDGRLALLHMPALVQRSPTPRLKLAGNAHETGKRDSFSRESAWVDLSGQSPEGWQNHAFCDAVLVADPARRAHASLKTLGPSSAAALLRQAWPIADLHPSRRHGPLPAKLAQTCRCGELHLSRNPLELLPLLDSLRERASGRAA